MNQLKSRRSKKLSLTNSRWAAYATAGAATALAGAGTAEADIHYSGLINQVFNAPAGSSSFGTFALAPGASFIPAHLATTSGFEGIALIGFRGAVSAAFNGATGGYAYVSRLGAGQDPTAHQFITSASGFFPGYGTLAFRSGYGGDQWLATGEGFVGFRFNTGSGVQYGWARLTMNSGAPLNSFTLNDFAWADVGQSIVTGQIPEPGSLGLLALGAAGLVAWRKQRAKAA